jgi:hypothetical protein
MAFDCRGVAAARAKQRARRQGLRINADELITQWSRTVGKSVQMIPSSPSIVYIRLISGSASKKNSRVSKPGDGHDEPGYLNRMRARVGAVST